jgi:hypothetical protein
MMGDSVQAIDAANGRAVGRAANAAPNVRAAVNPWENDRKDALKEALKAKVSKCLFVFYVITQMQIAAARPKPNPKKK